MNKLISVIIPYYKKREYIGKTLKSVINQSYKKLEIIIIYDDPNKQDLKLIKNIIQKDKRVKILINSKNIGVAKSRNKAIKISRGDYIAFIDADDIWKNRKIELQISFMIKKKIMISHTNYNIINNNFSIISTRIARDFFTINDLLSSCDIGLSTVIISKKIRNKVKFPSLQTKEDFVFWLKHLKIGNKIYSLNKNLTLWRKTDNSLSSNFFQKMIDGYKVYNIHMKFGVFKSLIYLFILSKNFLFKKLK